MASENGVVQSLDRALSILDAVGFSDQELSLADISMRVGLAKSTTHRLLHTLELRGFVSRNPVTGHYRPGMKTLRSLGPGPQIHQVLEDVALRSGETANLGALVGSQILYVDRADSPHALRWQLGVGERVPCHASGLGKAVLAFMDPHAVDRLLPRVLERRTEATITDRQALKAELAAVRRRGYAVDDEEFMEGVRCVAVPVRRAGGEVVGAISIAGPAFRLTREAGDAQAVPLRKAADELSVLLGSLPAGAPSLQEVR
jgi:DNA-binding IclR family transcriptional regulator